MKELMMKPECNGESVYWYFVCCFRETISLITVQKYIIISRQKVNCQPWKSKLI